MISVLNEKSPAAQGESFTGEAYAQRYDFPHIKFHLPNLLGAIRSEPDIAVNLKGLGRGKLPVMLLALMMTGRVRYVEMLEYLYDRQAPFTAAEVGEVLDKFEDDVVDGGFYGLWRRDPRGFYIPYKSVN